jgi:hypothetical protein
VPTPPALPTPDGKLMALRAQLAEAQSAQAAQQATIKRLENDLDAARVHSERLLIDLMHAQKHSHDLQAEHKTAASQLGDARGQLASLREELASARAASRGKGDAPLTVRAAGHKAGDVLQALVDGVSNQKEVRCAVVADDLGLVVASHGELGDEVAAVGALFGRAGLQAQKVLPLRKVQRVTVEDDQNVTLTLRPLETDDSVEGDLALITLAVGAAGDRQTENSRSIRPT